MRYALLFCSILTSFSALQGQSLPALASAVQALDQDQSMRSASWGLTVMDARTGEVVFSHNSYRSLVTASTMKAMTTATALSVLGSNFRFETVLEYDGQIDVNGTLQGNLYIRGSGDPTLGSDRFGESTQLDRLQQSWVAAVQAAGIQRIEGQVVGDASCYGTQLSPAKWPWEDVGNYYGAGPSGLNIHENLYYLDFEPGARQGDPTKVLRTRPNQEGMAFVNEVLTGKPGSGDNGYIYGGPYTHLRYLRGTIPPDRSVFTIKGSIPDPALFAARQLHAALQGAAIETSQSPASVRLLKQINAYYPRKRSSIHTHQSPRLAEIVEQTNLHSINLYAEALALAAGAKLDKSQQTDEATDAMTAYWAGRGISTTGMFVRDGSGLSPNNAVSTRQLAGILALMYQSPEYGSFEASLPVAGESGTLSRLMRGTTAQGRVRAKTGYISGVLGYAGYARSVNGEEYSFALVANYFTGSTRTMRSKLSQIMVKIAEGK